MSLNGWQTVTNDYSKTIITLATAFLAFTVTFWDSLLPPSIQQDWFWLLILIWVCLFVAIAAALYSAGLMVKLLLRLGERKHLMCAANMSYFAFGAAATALLALGIITALEEPAWSEPRALELATSVLKSTETDSQAQWQFVSMHSTDNAQSVLFSDEMNKRSATLVVRQLDGCVTVSLRRLENAPGQSTQVGLQATDFATKC